MSRTEADHLATCAFPTGAAPLAFPYHPALNALAWLSLAFAFTVIGVGWDRPATGASRPDAPIPSEAQSIAASPLAVEGIRFICPASQLAALEADMADYLAALDIAPGLVLKRVDRRSGSVVYTLDTPANDVSTLDLKDRPELAIRDATVVLPARHGRTRSVHTVSRKEILLALLQHGRLTEFKGRACDIEALKDHVGIRQNTVAWAEHLEWGWPNGDFARWNGKYWDDGTPRPGHALHEAVNDIFINQDRYAIGCYTATKVVMIQGVLDYYHRIKPDPERLRLVEQRLTRDQDPLVGVEPKKMWDFEADFDPLAGNRPGKLLRISYGAAPRNIVPGDWIYFLNTDPVSYQKLGYEGSNAVYLGRNKFDDYYNDHDHAYTYQEKLDEVYQWRHGVFSRSRDQAKIRPLEPHDLERLSRPPLQGGLLTDLRVSHYFFGHEDMPALATGS